MEHKTFEAEVKADDGVGSFVAYAATFGNVDRGGDRMIKGAFSKTLEKWRTSNRNLPIVLSHKWSDLNAYVGEAEPHNVYEDDHGLVIQGKLWLDEPEGRKVHKLMKAGLLTGWSFGYKVPSGGSRRARDGTTEIHEVELFEAGPTLVGMNEEAQLQAVKADGGTLWCTGPDGKPQAVGVDEPFWWEEKTAPSLSERIRAEIAAKSAEIEAEEAAAEREAQEAKAREPYSALRELGIPLVQGHGRTALVADGNNVIREVDLRTDAERGHWGEGWVWVPPENERRAAEEEERRRRRELEDRREAQRREAGAIREAREHYGRTAWVNIGGQRVHPADIRITE